MGFRHVTAQWSALPREQPGLEARDRNLAYDGPPGAAGTTGACLKALACENLSRYSSAQYVPATQRMSLGNAFELCGHGTLTAAAIGIFLWSAWHAPWKSWFVGRPDRQHI